MNQLSTLPYELQEEIISHLETNDLIQLRKTCVHFNLLCGYHVLLSALTDMLGGRKGMYLHRAVQNCQHDVLDFLLSLKSPTCLVDERGETALHWAARKGCDECAVQLLRAGADPNIISTNAWSPLMLAARLNNLEVAAKLIDAGVRLDVAGFHGWSPLHLARQYSHQEMASLLLSAGASEGLLDNDGLCTKRSRIRNKGWGVL